jgi:tRNA nucleotidyltransferase/poly(A) polymerase
VNSKKIEDLTQMGFSDLNNKIIRTPLEPFKTFMDDPLRILRCFRFATRF